MSTRKPSAASAASPHATAYARNASRAVSRPAVGRNRFRAPLRFTWARLARRTIDEINAADRPRSPGAYRRAASSQ
jgi:hypothetical protein